MSFKYGIVAFILGTDANIGNMFVHPRPTHTLKLIQKRAFGLKLQCYQ